MKQLAELVPIILFFVVYKMDGYQLDLGSIHYQFDGIYTATAALMAATTLQVVIARLTTGRLEKRQLWLLLAVLAFGGATIALHNELFIQWKPTIFNWVMGLVFLGSQFIGEKNLMARTLGNQVSAPYPVWTRLNYLWSAYFFVVGALDIIVVVGSTNIVFADFEVQVPTAPIVLSAEDNGIVEFQLFFRRS